MMMLYYCVFPYWLLYYAMLLIPTVLSDWAYTTFSNNRSKINKVISIDDIDDKFRYDPGGKKQE